MGAGSWVSRHHGDRGGGGHKATARDRVRLGYEQEEEEAPDLRARAVSGRREGARRVSGRAAGPAKLGLLRCGAQGKKLARLRPKLKERESSDPGRRKGRELGQ